MNNIRNKLYLQNTLGWDNNFVYIENWKLLWSKLPMIIVNEVTQVNLDNNKP